LKIGFGGGKTPAEGCLPPNKTHQLILDRPVAYGFEKLSIRPPPIDCPGAE
jgi:hypothetical protein